MSCEKKTCCEKKPQILKPWTPIETVESNGKDTVKVWGREYIMDASALFTSIISKGEEILSSPMRIVAKENGEDSVWEHKSNFIMSSEPDKAVICGVQKSEAFVINTAITVEYDGLIDVKLKVFPKGQTGDEVFGYAKTKPNEYSLERLWVEIPLKREMARLYQVSGASSVNFTDDTATTDKVVRSTGKLTSSMQLSFSPLVSLTGGEKGLSFFSESDQNWEPESIDKAIEILVSEEEVVLRLRLLDHLPTPWKLKDETGTGRRNYRYFPLFYQFGFMATPAKPYPKNPFKRKIFHFNGTVPGHNLDEYFITPSEEFGGMNAYDFMKEQGVTTLLLHETWNTTQNHWEIPIHRQSILRNIIRECHARGIEFVPYFGYEISTIGTYWTNEYVEKIVRKEKPDEEWFGWYRQPFQRDCIVCYRSEYRDALVAGLQKLVDDYGIDGVYFDLGMTACENEKHGCGYRDHEGKLHSTYPVYGVRELMKAAYSIFEPRGGLVNAHQGSACNFPSRTFIHSNYSGEEIAWFIFEEGADKIPPEYYDFTLSGKNFGVPADFIVMEKDDWNFEAAYSISSLCGSLPRPRNFKTLEHAGKVWKILDSFPISLSKWNAYVTERGNVSASRPEIKASYYEYTDIRGKKTLLAFITNPSRNAIDDVCVDFSKVLKEGSTAYNAMTKEDVNFDGCKLNLSFPKYKTYFMFLSE